MQYSLQKIFGPAGRAYGFRVALAAVVASLLSACAFVAQPDHVDEPGSASEAGVAIPEFEAAALDFQHRFDDTNSFPFLGAAVIDVDGSQNGSEIFLGGGAGQPDALFRFENGVFRDISSEAGLSQIAKTGATYSVLSLDLDRDGDVDLLVTRDDGLFLLTNTKGVFTSQEIPLELEAHTIPLQVAATDLNGDGWADLYVSTFVAPSHFRTATYNDPTHGRKNLLLLNRGRNKFRDITDASGIAVRQNTFLSAFVDLNGDRRADLVVAENTGRVRIFKNMGGLKFAEQPAPTGYGFWMGLGVADIDGDGDMDLFLSNAGNSVPAFAIKGDLREDQPQDLRWGLLRNDGDFNFVSITDTAGLAGMEFAWGATFEDFNLDGLPDLSVAENYIKWYVHKYSKAPGRFLLQAPGGRFVPSGELAGVENYYYGQSPLTGDFNNDGAPDLIYVNMDGPARAFLSKPADRPGNYLKVAFADTVANLGAKVTVKTADGESQTREFIAGLGFLTDQSPELIFGLGDATRIVSVDIVWPSGKRKTLRNVKINSRVSAD
ncbi:MAG: CRTAC1 family protein [bacterium]|nr:CRTAC1 family protein [bacterium]